MATLTKIHFTKISEKHKIISCQKGENAVKSRKVIFRKSQKLLTERASTEAAYSEHSISMAGYVNAVLAFVCFELPAREASRFCDF